MPAVVLGLDFGGSKTAAAVADVFGARLGEIRLPAEPNDTAHDTFHRGLRSAARLLADVAADRPLAAVGACTFGIPHDDRVELAPTIAGWERLSFGASVRAAFPTAEVRIATDVKAAAWAELRDGALAGCDSGLYVNLGTGFATAFVLSGAVVTGRNGAAGEIGYNLRCAGDGSLEDAVGGKALEAAAAAILGRPDVGALLADPRPAATRRRRQFVAELSFHLVNLVIALDPQRVVVGGGLVRSWDRFGADLGHSLEAAVPFPPELVVAAHPYDAPLLGALALGRAAAAPLSPVATVLTEGAPA
jgi:glucokinase